MWYLDSDRKQRRNNAWGRGGQNASLNVKMRAVAPRGERLHRYVAIGLLVFFVVGALTISWIGMRRISACFFSDNERFLLTAEGLDVASTGSMKISEICSEGHFGVGTNLYALDLEVVRTNLLYSPRIKAATVERIPPHTLRVRIEERTPVAVIPVSPVHRYAVDTEGVVIGISWRTNALPEISGLSSVDPAETRPGFHITEGGFFDALEAIQLSDSGVSATMTLKEVMIRDGGDLKLKFQDRDTMGFFIVQADRASLARIRDLPRILRGNPDRIVRLPQLIDVRGRDIVLKN